ncbi:MAG: hypothetical protein HDQ97_17645 [Lachnospiraceae bacterium]|nr:hypothetical protein [Lachnospiraceae bacterium]
MSDSEKTDAEKTDSQKSNSEKTDSSKKAVRCKNMMYAQQMNRLPAKTIEHLIELLIEIAPKKYALILHDSDVNAKGEPEEDHVHVMMSFENARSLNSIAKALGDKPQYLQMWKGKAENGYSYLIHATDSSISKRQYSPEEVTANFDYQEEMQRIAEEVKRSRQTANCQKLLDSLYKGEITKEGVEKLLSGSQYGIAKRQIEDVWCKHLQFQAAEWREEMKKSGKRIKVIWISGEAGTGKTSLAREYAEKTNQSYFITGSSRDIFQNYSGEHTIIIDELRADMMKYADLLRILDPFGSQVMAPSRYSDKPLVCDLILITSPYDPVEFYWQLFRRFTPNIIDGLEQLLRRITLTIEMDENHIRAVEYDRKEKIYLPVGDAEKENSYSKKYREKDCPASTLKDLFEDMFREAPCGETGNA